MKKVIFITVFSLFFVEGISQTTYYPFPTDSAYWSVEHGWYDISFGIYHCTSTTHYALLGDTSIQGNMYSKIYLSAFYDTTFINSSSSYYCALREDLNKKIFVRRPTDITDVLLYDFSLNVGDSFCYQFFNSSCTGNYSVTGVDSILIDGNYRKRISLQSFGDTQTWVEGIGNMYGLFDIQYVGSGITSLKCFKENGILKYGFGSCHCDNFAGLETLNKNKIKIYPNPSHSILNVELNNFSGNFFSFTLLSSVGQVIKSATFENINYSINISDLEGGIYFIVIADDKNNKWHQKLLKD